MSFAPEQPLWIANNGTGVSTVDDATGVPDPSNPPLIVRIPAPNGTGVSAPSGTVFNGSSGFTIPSTYGSAPTQFLFDTEDGTIAGWYPALGSNAVLVVNHAASGAVYKGLALGSNTTGESLYAADFGTGKIDVFNTNFQQVTLSGKFTDPNLPQGYAPFDIENIGGTLFVTYALQDSAKQNDVPGQGNGFIDEFDANGNLLRRFESQGALNAPWGMAVAPASFGTFAGDLLVGNFGDGHIDAYNLGTGAFQGQLTDVNGQPLAIDGLWTLMVGGGGAAGDPNTLYFTAGSDGETHGLFGSLTPADVPTSPSPSSTVLPAQGTTFSVKAGQSFQKVVATFSEAGATARNFHVSVNWGDGTRASSARVKATRGGFEAMGGHRYRATGTYTVEVTITDHSGHQTTVTSQAMVSSAPRRITHQGPGY